MSLSPFLKLLVAVQLHPSGKECGPCQKKRKKYMLTYRPNPLPSHGASSLPLLYLGRSDSDSLVLCAEPCPPPVKLKQSMILATSIIRHHKKVLLQHTGHRSPCQSPLRCGYPASYIDLHLEKHKLKKHKLVRTANSGADPLTSDAGPPSSGAPFASSVALWHAACRSASEKPKQTV